MADVVRKINVSTGEGYDTIHPETRVEAITNMGAALDAYKEAYIDPELELMIKSINTTNKPNSAGNVEVKEFKYYKQQDGDPEAAQLYSKNNPGVFVYISD